MSGGVPWRRLARVALAVAIVGCADKTVDAPRVAGSPRFTLQIMATAQRTATAQKLVVFAFYYSSVVSKQDDSVRVLDSATAAITGGPQQLGLNVDLTTCLSDQTRRGSRDACSMYVVAFLEPIDLDPSGELTGSAFDYQVVGPLDASPGHPPTVRAIDLSTSHFAINHWDADEALRLGSDQTPQQFDGPITGAASGSASTPPTIFAVTQGVHLTGGTNNSGQLNYDLAAQLAIFQNGVWRRVNGPSFQTFQDVAAFSPTDVYMAAGNGLYHYDGSSISAVSAVQERIVSVAVSSQSGGGRYLIAGTPNGSVWVSDLTTFTKYSISGLSNVDLVCITGAAEAFAGSVGNASLFRFNGTSWVSVPSTFTQSKQDLQCLGPGQAYVGAQGSPGPLLKWNGTGWTQIPGPTGTGARSMTWAVASANEIYAVGDSSGNTNRGSYRYDGATWREVARVGFTGNLRQRPWADPRGGAAYVATSGSSLTRLDMVTPTGTSVVSYQPSLRDVTMPSASTAFVVGGNDFLARWNGSRWTVDAPPVGLQANLPLLGVWSDGASNAWAVGSASTILRWDGTRWNVVSGIKRAAGLPSDNFNGVWGAAGTVWVVGDATIVRCTSTATCTTDPVPGSGALYAIWGTSATNVFAVGDAGRIVHYDGTAWTAMSSATSGRLAAVSGTGPNDVWTAGDNVVVHYDGKAWSAVTPSILGSGGPSGSTGTKDALWGVGPHEMYAGTSAHFVLRLDGTDWGEMPGQFAFESRAPVAIAGPPNGCAIAVGSAGHSGGPILFRGVGPTGCFATPMTPPASWP